MGKGDGMYENERYFKCEEGFAIFVPYTSLKPDTRFDDSESQNDLEETEEITEESASITEGKNRQLLYRFILCISPHYPIILLHVLKWWNHIAIITHMQLDFAIQISGL